MRNNDTQHIVRLSRSSEEPLRVALPRHTPHVANFSAQEHEAQMRVNFLGSRKIFSKLATLFLIPMIFIYPLAPAYAASEGTSTDETVATTTATTDTVATTPDADASVTPTDTLTADLSSAVTGALALVAGVFGTASTTDITQDGTTTTSASTTAEGSTTPATDSEATTTDSSVAPPEDNNASSTATSTPPETTASSTLVSQSGTGESTGGNTGVGNDASSTDTLASTSPSVVSPQKTPEEIAKEMLSAQEDSIRASIRKEVEDEFTKGCVTLDTTGYYCLKDRSNGGSSLAPSNTITDVSSAPDASGLNKQIFMTRGGLQEQLTHSTWDNAFPTMDVSGRSIVWQGNVSGRWQIFFSNTEATSAPSVLEVTHSNESNFNPKVDGDDVVWQGWVDGNWEIFLAEHLQPAEYLSMTTLPETNKLVGADNTWKITRITTNSVHDMFPAVAGGLVTWQSFQDNAWNVYVYNVKTGATQKISSSGEKSEKPRFAITWDERTPSGDARMVGYDIATGKTVDLTNEARQVNDQEAPYTPPAPISQPDQASLPIGGATGASTSIKDDTGDGAGANDLGI